MNPVLLLAALLPAIILLIRVYKLDKIEKQLLTAVMVHDLDFTWGDGTVKAFNEANKRLLKNCIICATDTAPWYSWKRYALIAEACTFYLACKKLGWVAWL